MHSQMSCAVTLLAATFLMGSGFVAGKILITSGFPPMMLVGYRFLVAALATLPLVAICKQRVTIALVPKHLRLRDAAFVVLIGLFQTAGVMCLLFYAMRFVSASIAAILLFTNPIWVALLGRLFLGESLHRARIIALALGVVGVALAIGFAPEAPSRGGQIVGELTGLASALCWATSTIINKRADLRMCTWALNFWQMLIGACVVLAIAYTSGQHWPASTTPQQWGWFFYLSIPASTGSYGLWFVALSKGDATKTSSYLFLAPLFAAVSSLCVLHTNLSWLQALAGVLVGLAIWLVNRDLPVRRRLNADQV
jgi:drug/metabolite transporter (DMT)-like permease